VLGIIGTDAGTRPAGSARSAAIPRSISAIRASSSSSASGGIEPASAGRSPSACGRVVPLTVPPCRIRAVSSLNTSTAALKAFGDSGFRRWARNAVMAAATRSAQVSARSAADMRQSPGKTGGIMNMRTLLLRICQAFADGPEFGAGQRSTSQTTIWPVSEPAAARQPSGLNAIERSLPMFQEKC
jgi:hypothetical protein